MNIGPTRFSYLGYSKTYSLSMPCFLGKIVLGSSFGIDFDKLFGLHNWQS